MNEYTIDSILKREFPTIDGKRSWGITNEIWKHCVKYGKDLAAIERKECEDKAEKARKEAEDAKKAKGASSDPNRVVLTPEQRADELAALLDEKLLSRELTASDIRELKDIFNLKAKDQDIVIEMVDFANAYKEEFDIMQAAMELIKRYNERVEK
jgi:hypothetical protein